MNNFEAVKNAVAAEKDPRAAVTTLLVNLCIMGNQIMSNQAETEKFFSELSREANSLANACISHQPAPVPVSHDS